MSTPFTSCLGLCCAVFYFEGEDCSNCGNNCNKELRKEKSEEQEVEAVAQHEKNAHHCNGYHKATREVLTNPELIAGN